MKEKEQVIAEIQEAFGKNPYPGDAFLQGSFEGCEPYEEISAFIGKTIWQELDSKMLDGHYCALNFFSEAGFRFFIPAYLIADLREELLTSDPLFYFWHGFSSISVEVPAGSQTFRRTTGGKTLLNPRRYGAMNWKDYARYRLSIFNREEARAIVAYMTYKRGHADMEDEKLHVDAALKEFWLDRAENAPTREDLESHLQEEMRYVTALQQRHEGKT